VSYVTPVGPDDGRRALVRSIVTDSLWIAALTTTAMVVVLLTVPQHGDVILKGYLAAIGLLLGLKLISSIAAFVYSDSSPKAGGTGRRSRNAAPNRPTDLVDIEHRVSWAKVSRFDYQSRLRPVVRDIAAQRLAANWHIDLAREPEVAKARLGSALWDQIEDIPSLDDPREQRGTTITQLRAIVESLESI